jgi:hypothetical protein
MSNDNSRNSKKRARKHKLDQNQLNEFPRQGNENPQIGLVGNVGADKRDAHAIEDNTLEKEGEILGREVKKRVGKDQDEGVTFDPSRSDE